MRWWTLIANVLAYLVLSPPSLFGQETTPCAFGQAHAYLESNNVRARLLNNGYLFGPAFSQTPPYYEVPRGQGVQALFSTSLLLAGYVDDSLRVSGAAEGLPEFAAGPLDEQGQPPLDCNAYDRMYRVTVDDILFYQATGQPPADLASWPVGLGAPVLDGDGISDNYNLAGGDLPALMGDEMVWWVMNDLGNDGSTFQSPEPNGMGMEVQVTAFSYNTPGLIGNTTFYQYKLLYKGQAPLKEAYMGFYVDPDFGEVYDDYIGSDTTLHMAYVYNGDNNDEGNYGVNPPALGHVLLDGLLVDADGRDNNGNGEVDEPNERLGMETFVCLEKSGRYSDPDKAEEYYHVLQGRYRNGEPMTLGGDGGKSQNSFSNEVVKHCYTGMPEDQAFWTEMNPTGTGERNRFFDTRFTYSSGPFHMNPGDNQTITFAIVWSQGADHLDSLRQLRKDATYVHSVHRQFYSPNPKIAALLPQRVELPHLSLTFAENYPNPFGNETTIRYSLPISASVHLAVYDALGQEVAVLVDQQQEAEVYTVPFPARNLPPGVYFYRLTLNGYHTFTKTMLRI